MQVILTVVQGFQEKLLLGFCPISGTRLADDKRMRRKLSQAFLDTDDRGTAMHTSSAAQRAATTQNAKGRGDVERWCKKHVVAEALQNFKVGIKGDDTTHWT